MKTCITFIVAMFFVSMGLNAQDACATALIAVEGTNSVPATTSQYWFSYTMPSAGKLKVSSTPGEYVYLLTGLCDDLTNVAVGLDSASATTIAPGETVYISWLTDGGGNFNWNLEVVPYSLGDSCSFAATAYNGSNTIPPTANKYYWHTFTRPAGYRVELISPDEGTVRGIDAYRGTCNNLVKIPDANHRSSLSIVDIADEETIYVEYWIVNSIGVDWNLDIEPLAPGDNCNMPCAANLGTNQLLETLNKYYWYSFVMPASDTLFINAPVVGNIIDVLQNSCDTQKTLETSFGHDTIVGLNMNDTVLIRFVTINDYNIAWEIRVKQSQTLTFNPIPDQFIGNDSLVLSAYSSSGLAINYELVSGPVTLDDSILYFTGTGTVELEASQAGNDWFYPADAVQQSFDITNVNAVDNLSDSELSVYPNPAGNELYLARANHKVNSIQLYTLNGHLLKEFMPAIEKINTTGLKNGIYILKVITTEAVFSFRLIKK